MFNRAECKIKQIKQIFALNMTAGLLAPTANVLMLANQQCTFTVNGKWTAFFFSNLIAHSKPFTALSPTYSCWCQRLWWHLLIISDYVPGTYSLVTVIGASILPKSTSTCKLQGQRSYSILTECQNSRERGVTKPCKLRQRVK